MPCSTLDSGPLQSTAWVSFDLVHSDRELELLTQFSIKNPNTFVYFHCFSAAYIASTRVLSALFLCNHNRIVYKRFMITAGAKPDI